MPTPSDRRPGLATAAPVPDAGAVPLHRRTLTYEAVDHGDDLLVVGRLRDDRPWAEGTDLPAALHDMELRVLVRRADLTVTAATAVMHAFPHAECPAIEDAFAGLVGLSVARGYTRAVQERLGGPRGCTHLEHLARSLGPVVIQAVTSARAAAVLRGEAADLLAAGGDGGSPWARDSCHVWAEDGVAEAKLAAGWRPGTGPYPAPALVTFLGRGEHAVPADGTGGEGPGGP